MPRTLVKHGTNAGYRAELVTDTVCSRCQNAHRVFQTQYSRASRAAGIKYAGNQVIDHLYGTSSYPKQGGHTAGARVTVPLSASDFTLTSEPAGTEPQQAAPAGSGPSLADRIRALAVGSPDNEYVEETETPDYISASGIDPDPEPADTDYARVADDSADYVINAAGMAKIEDTLGTYLSVFGITFEMIDPYCGPVLAENMHNIVVKWSKVIARYPKAADIFMNEKGGIIMLWIGAIQATWPVLFAMYEHHLSKNVQTSGGNIFRREGSGIRPNDPMQPPMPDDFNYSARG